MVEVDIINGAVPDIFLKTRSSAQRGVISNIDVSNRGALVMTEVDAHEIEFQCPNCGQELKQTIGRLKAGTHMTCGGCGVGINIDTDRLANAAEEIRKAIEKVPPEITIKFFR
jgi:predicted RNA-binding Zn-ribbon protein involved in translation (DUF1610 family)